MSKKKPRPDKVTDTPMPNITGPGGRPTDYRPEYDALLIEHMSNGLSFESFGGVVEASDSTIDEWAKHNASFQAAKELAFKKCRLFWEKLGVYYVVEGRSVEVKDEKGKVVGKTKSTEKLNSSTYALNMVNRFGWKRSGIDESEPGRVTINLHAEIMRAINEKKQKGAKK